eukprot:scaffold115110_cov21-Tisochrysis_lutea.AAC.1
MYTHTRTHARAHIACTAHVPSHLDDFTQDLVQELQVGPACILRREFNVIAAQGTQVLDSSDCVLDDLLLGHAQLVLHVDLTGGNEGVHPGQLGLLDCLPSAIQVCQLGARQAANDWHVAVGMHLVAHDACNVAHGIKIVGAGHWEAGLNDVYAQLGELACDVQLFLAGEGGSGGLLSVTQGGVENAQIVGVVNAARNLEGEWWGRQAGVNTRCLACNCLSVELLHTYTHTKHKAESGALAEVEDERACAHSQGQISQQSCEPGNSAKIQLLERKALLWLLT